MKYKSILLAACLLAPATSFATCFIVYDAKGKTVYQAQTPPIDMTDPIDKKVKEKYPGGHMVFSLTIPCETIASPDVDVKDQGAETALLSRTPNARGNIK